MTSKTAASATAKDDDNSSLPLEMTSLQSLGTYMLFDEINHDTCKGACEFIIKANYMLPPTTNLTLIINSPGGSVYDGFGIVDLMECSRLKIQTVAIGMVASMGSMIFVAGSKGMRIMSRNAYIMTHQYFGAMAAKYHEFVAQRSHEDELHNRFVEHYVRHSKMSESQVRDVILNSSDRYISAKEALKLGLCDKVQDPWS